MKNKPLLNICNEQGNKYKHTHAYTITTKYRGDKNDEGASISVSNAVNVHCQINSCLLRDLEMATCSVSRVSIALGTAHNLWLAECTSEAAARISSSEAMGTQ